MWRWHKIKFRAILFDLDGTLLDTLVDIAGSMNAALSRFGFPTHPTDSYRYFTGDGMDGLVRRILPEDRRDDETVNKCLAVAKDHYRRHWSDNTSAYPGIPELLSALEGFGLPKAVLSNKPDEFTRIMVEKLLRRWLFQIIRGQKPRVPKKPDPAAALDIADELKIPPDRFIYLGDTNTDMQTANAAGMYAVGVLWGFRDAQELLENGAKALVETPQDIMRLLDNASV